jgi:hypothetical protein
MKKTSTTKCFTIAKKLEIIQPTWQQRSSIKKKSDLVYHIRAYLWKSSDGSKLDFLGFGYSKQKLASRRARNWDEIGKVAQDEWPIIVIEMIKKAFKICKKRLRMINKHNDGEQIENTSAIHRKKFCWQKKLNKKKQPYRLVSHSKPDNNKIPHQHSANRYQTHWKPEHAQTQN